MALSICARSLIELPNCMPGIASAFIAGLYSTFIWRHTDVNHAMQVTFSVQVFLARPVDEGLHSFDDCAQVIEPFSINTSIDRCAEPAPMGAYR